MNESRYISMTYISYILTTTTVCVAVCVSVCVAVCVAGIGVLNAI